MLRKNNGLPYIIAQREKKTLLKEDKAEPQTAEFVLYYFPSSSKNPFGHLAIGNFKLSGSASDDFLKINPGDIITDKPEYLSFRGADSESAKANDTNFQEEFEIYEKKFFAIKLSMIDAQKVKDAMQVFANADLTKYKVLKNNCATNVRDFLKATSILPKEERFIDPRPAYYAKRVWKIMLNNISEKRHEIANSTIDPQTKILNLIENDIERLNLRMQLDEISHEGIVKNRPKKEGKILLLKEALETLNDPNHLDRDGNYRYQNILIKLQEIEKKLNIDSNRITKNETGKNFHECLNQFKNELLNFNKIILVKTPTNQSLDSISSNEVRSGSAEDILKKRINDIKAELELIKDGLVNRNRGNFDSFDLIKKLVGLNIERLVTEKQLIGLSSWRFLKNTKQNQIDQTQLNKIYQTLSTKPVNLENCLDTLKKSLELPTGNHKLIEFCLEYFPYDRIHSISQSESNYNSKSNSFVSTGAQTKTSLGSISQNENDLDHSESHKSVSSQVENEESESDEDIQQIMTRRRR